MNWRNAARRFAVFIQECGATPIVAKARDYKTVAKGLQRQYEQLRQLQPERVRAAKRTARAAIRSAGLAEAAAGLISPLQVSPTTGKQRYKKSGRCTQSARTENRDISVGCRFTESLHRGQIIAARGND